MADPFFDSLVASVKQRNVNQKSTTDSLAGDPFFQSLVKSKLGNSNPDTTTGSNDIPSIPVNPKESWLDKVLGAMDYAGNISRSAIKGTFEGGFDPASGLEFAKDAALKKRYTTPTEIKDLATEGLGLGKVRIGKDDGQFSFGDVGDFLLDVGVGAATDPTSWVSAGLGSALKGGMVAKALPGLQKGMLESKLGMATDLAKKYQTVKNVGSAGLGAIYGASLPGEDATVGDRLTGAALGAGAVIGGKKYLPAVGKKINEKMDKAANWYAVATRGEKFANYSDDYRTGQQALEKIQSRADQIKQGNFAALKDLDPEEGIRAIQFQKDYMDEFAKRRNPYIEQLNLDMGISKLDPASDKFKAVTESPEYQKAFNAITQKTTDEMDQAWVPYAMKKESQKVQDALVLKRKFNEEVISELNKVRFGIESGKATKEGKGIVGIAFHSPDPKIKAFTNEQMNAADDAMKQAKIHMMEREERGDLQELVEKLKKDPEVKDPYAKAMELENARYEVYATDLAKKFLSAQEMGALKTIAQYKTMLPQITSKTALGKFGQQTASTMEKYVLNNFDAATNWVKTGLLHFSLAWFRNNYADNLMKSYVTNGLDGAFRTATLGTTFKKGILQDVKDIYKGKLVRKYNSDEMGDMVRLGVVDSPFFQAMNKLDDRFLEYVYDPKKIQELKNQKDIANKFVDWWQEKLSTFELSPGYWGSIFEGTGRASTYLTTLKTLKASPIAKELNEEALKKLAAKTARDTFFDYGKTVGAFERATFKRVAPFYSFYKNNIPFWVKAVVDPESAGRIANIEKVRRGIGREPTPMEKEGMPDYVLKKGGRVLGQDIEGNKRYVMMPSSSSIDAFQMLNPTEWGDQAIEKTSPLLKTPAELLTGYDTFTKGPLLPTATTRKFTFSGGYEQVAIKEALKKLGFDPDEPGLGQAIGTITGATGVDVDGRGNPYATKDIPFISHKILQTAFPHGLIEQVAGSVGKAVMGKETPGQAILNRVSPQQTVEVSPRQEQMVRKYRQPAYQQLRQLLEARKKREKQLKERLKR